MAVLIDGKAVAAQIRAELKEKVQALALRRRAPALAVVLVGEDPASQVYVGAKAKACEEIGMRSETHKLSRDTPAAELLALIDRLNADDGVDGILVQHPIPNVKDENEVFNRIRPEKDVDCFHSSNVGRLMLGDAYLLPCTPAGVVELLLRYKIPTAGKHAVIVGRSNIVGKPLANLLMQKREGGNCTVTVVHTGTPKPGHYTREADILVAAAGRPGFVTADMVKPGAVIIDVGTNRVEDVTKKQGYRLAGDVDFGPCEKKASFITPVPGGVGPMTIAMLLKNTVTAAEKRFG